MIGMKLDYESVTLYRDVLVNVNMSSTLNTDGGERDRGRQKNKMETNKKIWILLSRKRWFGKANDPYPHLSNNNIDFQ